MAPVAVKTPTFQIGRRGPVQLNALAPALLCAALNRYLNMFHCSPAGQEERLTSLQRCREK